MMKRSLHRRTRRLGFETLENRELLSAQAIIDENNRNGVNDWKIGGYLTADGLHTSNGMTDDTHTNANRIQGYTNKASVNLGETIGFFVDSRATYSIKIYRLGWYNGVGGGSLVRTIANLNPAIQTKPTPDPTTGLTVANWVQTATWTPQTADDGRPIVSGIFIALLVRNDGFASSIPFVVRNDSEATAVVMQTADTTWQAYNFWGGKSLYYHKNTSADKDSRAFKVSYDRPYDQLLYVRAEEWETVRFMERNGYDVSYITHIDTDKVFIENADAAVNGSLRRHEVYIVGGHDEYWSGEHVKALEAARINGTSLIFLSGNEGFWKTRWESNYRTLVSYKETQNNANLDPTNLWTGMFRDRRSIDQEGVLLQNENALTGTIFAVNFNGNTADPTYTTPVQIPVEARDLRLWRNTNIATGARTQLVIPMGAEWDEDWESFRPAGLINLSRTTVSNLAENTYIKNVNQVSDAQYTPSYDFYDTATSATHSLTLYRASAGSLVFSAGMSSWSWALAPDVVRRVLRDGVVIDAVMEDLDVKQAMVNLLADMGVPPTPGRLESGLSYATTSTDTIAPSSTVSSASGTPINANENSWTVQGTASDSGGLVAGVEISRDGGATWQRVSTFPPGASVNWSYQVTLPNTQTPFFLSRAVDDSVNMQAVSVRHDTGTSTLYVYGGSPNNNILVTKTGVNFNVTNNANPLGAFATSQVSHIVVQLAIGQNTISLDDPALDALNLTQILGSTATVAAFTVRGGIGKDTVTLDHTKIGGSLTVDGGAGVDRIDVTTSNVQGATLIKSFYNGMAQQTVGGQLILAGTIVNLTGAQFDSNLDVYTSNFDDRVTIFGSIAAQNTVIVSYAGSDIIRLENSYFGNLQVFTSVQIVSGDGHDQITLLNSSFDVVYVLLGEGNDTLNILGSVGRTSRQSSANAQGGGDLLNYNGTWKALNAQADIFFFDFEGGV